MNTALLKTLIAPTAILEIGAWIGETAKELHAAFPESSLILVEGNPFCAPSLRATGFPHIISMVGKDCASRPYYRQPGTPIGTGNGLYKEDSEWFLNPDVSTVSTVSLDRLFTEAEFDLIVMDIQGAELEALKHGPRVLSKAKWLVLEVPVDGVIWNEGSPTRIELEGFLEASGFKRVVVLEDLVHPKLRTVIQQDCLYERIS